MVRNVHAAEWPRAAHEVVAVHDVAVGQDVCEGALRPELAVTLAGSGEAVAGSGRRTFVKYLHGALSASGSSECRKGQALPAWQAPWR